MIAMTYKLREQLQEHPAFRRRGFRRIVKAALKATVLKWHREYAPIHFTRAAYRRYSYLGVYRRRKQRGEPMVESGTLRERILQPRTAEDVGGTSRRAYINFTIGRPPQYTEEELKRQILIEMVKRKTSYRAAERRVYRRAQYSRAGREMFKTHIPVVAGGEARSLRAFLRDRVIRGMKEARN
ncbi:MAG: hypothetical protein PVH68_04775 [Armatimonadota bacterium]|jgi:hypothetical protein